MPEDMLRSHAERFLMAAKSHEECLSGKVVSVDEKAAIIELELNVEMPLQFKVDGVSPNGVRTKEPVLAKLLPSYPWSPPLFYLRQDFPRDLPHLQPGSASSLPRPCLIEGNAREYFFQYGLVELGVFNLLHQLVLWLRRAAEGTLIDHGRGWEPTLRRDIANSISVDAEACRAKVDREGGFSVLKSRFFREGRKDAALNANARVWLDVLQDEVPLKRDDKTQFTWNPNGEFSEGNTVCVVIWPDKLPGGEAFISKSYLPETVENLADLLQRADELRCGRALRLFQGNLERCFDGFTLESPVSVGIILCARRPCHLIGSASDIELLPYVVELRASKGRALLIAAGDKEPVAPASQRDTTNPVLLRHVSGAPEIAPVAMIGCGSVGSKMAMHLARSGVEIPVLCDEAVLNPHNMARHALARPPLSLPKASELAKEIRQLGQSPAVFEDDLAIALRSRDSRKIILPKQAGYAINSTASLAVREALSSLAANDIKPRLAETALFGRGDGGFLVVEGSAHNPTLCDLIDELNATVGDERIRSLLFDREFGLTEVQIGQGCGALTMPMTDMRLSAMTAALTEEFVAVTQKNDDAGQIVIGIRKQDSSDTAWFRQTVAPFKAVDIEGPKGWTMRLSRRVLDKVEEEVARYPTVETGGVLIGSCSARQKTVTVVDLVGAPEDSQRTAALFVLGTKGLKDAIKARHAASGNTLFDVGTWHSHLADHGPSSTDRNTAKQLAAERPPPSALLIVAPTRRYALMHAEAAT